jgi:nucleotide-binding universal stress UspA family protein
MSGSCYVVGVDGSAPADAALAWAVRAARRDGCALALVRVVDPGAAAGIEALDAAEVAGEHFVQAAVERVRATASGFDVTGELLIGAPIRTLANRARPGDTLVVGTHKTGFVSGRLLGSRSVQFALAAPGTVVVVPEADLRFREGVVAGIDRAETASEIARRAACEAVDRGMRLTLVHAMPPGRALEPRGVLETPLAIATDAALEVEGMLEVRSRVSTRPAAEALLDASRGSSLLVVGPGSLGDDRTPLGTTLHEVLLNANAPVLVVRRAPGA